MKKLKRIICLFVFGIALVPTGYAQIRTQRQIPRGGPTPRPIHFVIKQKKIWGGCLTLSVPSKFIHNHPQPPRGCR